MIQTDTRFHRTPINNGIDIWKRNWNWKKRQGQTAKWKAKNMNGNMLRKRQTFSRKLYLLYKSEIRRLIVVVKFIQNSQN